MATKKELLASDVKTTRSFLNQLIDVLQEDISSSVSRRKYQVFVTGGIGPGVTSSLFQTVYDQDFTLQTANPIFDITVGISPPDVNNSGIAAAASYAHDVTGKYMYHSQTLMMREKTDIYSQFAQSLLGSRTSMFKLPVDASFKTSQTLESIDSALFIAYKRLFARDQIKRETFAMRFYTTASIVRTHTPIKPHMPVTITDIQTVPRTVTYTSNLYKTSVTGSTIFTDIGSSDARYFDVGGQYGYIVNAANTKAAVGLLYYDSGVAVFDIAKITSGSQFISGTISAMHPLGRVVLGRYTEDLGNYAPTVPSNPLKCSLIPDLMVSASIDDIVDHFCYSRFQSGSLTAMTFQNVTNINSSLIFCRALPDDFNYSSNPTYVEQSGDNAGRLTIYDPSLPEETQETFTYVTTIGLYDNADGLLAVAKLSRPVEKNPGRDLTFRVRLDF